MSEALKDVAFDVFGKDPAFSKRLSGLLDTLIEQVFDLEVEGEENLPDGPFILVGNHAGAFPWDAVVLIRAFEQRNRSVRPLLEDALMTAPFLGTWMSRLGCVRASQENALRILDRGEPVAVFPEGFLGLSKVYKHRYKLVRFGRGGFVRLAVKAGVPLVPVAILGAEDTAPLLSKFRFLFRGTFVSYLPVTPLFPWLGPLGVLPLPAKWKIRILPPIEATEKLDDDAKAADVTEVAQGIHDQLQGALDELESSRPARFRLFGR